MPNTINFGPDNVTYFRYLGATVEIRRYASDWYPCVEGYQYFIAINGDHYPYGLPYFRLSKAIRAAKRRIEKEDFETDDIFLMTGVFTVDHTFASVYWDGQRWVLGAERFPKTYQQAKASGPFRGEAK
jgi:hypothetical protein